MSGEIVSSVYVSYKAKLDITPDTVNIRDEPDLPRTINYGFDKFDILVEDTDIGKKNKKLKKITIRKKLPVCPISMLPILPKTGFKFYSGFALNVHNVKVSQHHHFILHPAYYCMIADGVFLTVKITDKRKIEPEVYEILCNTLNNDIAEVIREQYNYMFGGTYDYRMRNPPVDTTHTYHKKALRQLVDEGKLEVGVSETIYSDIMILTPESFDYIYPNGGMSYLRHYWTSSEKMMATRQELIESYL